MKNILLAVNHGYYFWSTSIYMGMLWSLHFIFYPSWKEFTIESLSGHFLAPIQEATTFFTFIVPVMMLSGLVMIYFEWKTKLRLIALLVYACLLAMLVVGYFLIGPVNEFIVEGLENGTLLLPVLNEKLMDWMHYNDMRMVLMTIMWLILLYYFYKKNSLLHALSQ